MKLVKKVGSKLGNMKSKFGAAALMGATSVSAFAQSVDISPAVQQAKSDIATAGSLIIGVVVAVAAFSWIRRVIK